MLYSALMFWVVGLLPAPSNYSGSPTAPPTSPGCSPSLGWSSSWFTR